MCGLACMGLSTSTRPPPVLVISVTLTRVKGYTRFVGKNVTGRSVI